MLLTLLAALGFWLARNRGGELHEVAGDVEIVESSEARRRSETPVPEPESTRPPAEEPDAIPADDDPSPGDSPVRVVVTWAEDRQPAAGVRVWCIVFDGEGEKIFDRRDVTGEDGIVLFAEAPPGRLTVQHFRHQGYAQEKVDAKDRRGETVVRFEIEEQFRGEGRVLTEAGEPIAGAEVYLTKGNASLSESPAARTDGAGRFFLRGISAGRGVVAQASGFLISNYRRFELTEDGLGVRPMEIRLESGRARLRVGVARADGTPIAGAEVRFGYGSGLNRNEIGPEGPRWISPPPAETAVTDEEGRCETARIRSGPLDVYVRVEDYGAIKQSVDVLRDEVTEVRIVVPEGVVLFGVLPVTEPARLPVVGVRVDALISKECRVTLEGSYELRGLPLGFEAFASFGEGQIVREKFTGEPGERIEWSPQGAGSARLRVVVRDRTRSPLVGVGVSLRPAGVPARDRNRRATDAEGRADYVTKPGAYVVVVSQPVPGAFERTLAWTRTDLPPGVTDLEIDADPEVPSVLTGGVALLPGEDPSSLFVLIRADLGANSVGQVALDAAGRFRVEDLPAGPWVVYVNRGGREHIRWKEFDHRRGEADLGVLGAEGQGWIVFRRADENDRTTVGIELERVGGGASLKLRSVAAGRRTPPLPIGAYDVTMSTRRGSKVKRVVVDTDATTEVHLDP
ncbi:MAG: carboxypeptidase-like regulatory domain-containing protein [Planctomycetota bacterium]